MAIQELQKALRPLKEKEQSLEFALQTEKSRSRALTANARPWDILLSHFWSRVSEKVDHP